jgi:hemoglobin
MPDKETTLYTRIGGARAVAEMIDEFYSRVLADPELRPFFENVTVERLTKMQSDFFAAALDGPMQTNDIDLAAIHQGMKITRQHLTRFVNHLIEVLDARDAITSKDAMEIIFRIATYSDQIIGESGGSDG